MKKKTGHHICVHCGTTATSAFHKHPTIEGKWWCASAYFKWYNKKPSRKKYNQNLQKRLKEQRLPSGKAPVITVRTWY